MRIAPGLCLFGCEPLWWESKLPIVGPRDQALVVSGPLHEASPQKLLYTQCALLPPCALRFANNDRFDALHLSWHLSWGRHGANHIPIPCFILVKEPRVGRWSLTCVVEARGDFFVRFVVEAYVRAHHVIRVPKVEVNRDIEVCQMAMSDKLLFVPVET